MPATKTKSKSKGQGKAKSASEHFPPNDMSRRERTRRQGRCQLCEAKVPLEEQYTLTNDLENGEVIVKKNAARKGAERMSHYCGDCKDKRVKQKSAWLAQRDGDAKPVGRPKGSSKAKPKATKPKAKKAVKPKSKPKAKAKAKASSGDEPF